MELILLISGIIIGGIGVWFIARFRYAGKHTADIKIKEAQLVASQHELGDLKPVLDKERQANISLNSELSAFKADHRNLQEKLAEQKEKFSLEFKNLANELQELKAVLDKERQANISLNSELAAFKADHRNLQEKLAEQTKQSTLLQEKFSLEFKNLANEILEEKTRKFTDQNKINMGELLNPLKEKITTFEQKVEQSNKENSQNSTALREQIKGLKELNQEITKEAGNLTRALKGDTKAQGNWGEFILESILEKSGLREGVEYETQVSLSTEEGKRSRPDVVVKLPNNKNIIIDSKVSLTAYERCVNAETEENHKETQLKMHIKSLRKHIKDLSEKDYQSLYGVQGLDYVLLFVPIEPAFILGVQHDSELFTDAYESNIVMVSPTTLMAVLRTIANIWRNERQNRNVLEISKQGGELYDKFVAFTEDLEKLGSHIDRSQKSYEEAKKKLTEGRGNLVKRAQDIKTLGVKTSKQMDQKLIDRAEN